MMVFLVAVRVKDDKKKVLLQSYMKKFCLGKWFVVHIRISI